MRSDEGGSPPSLICRLGRQICALSLDHVVETMRPLPVEPLAGAPDFVRGVSIVRGAPTPVVDTASLVGGRKGTPRRWITVRTGTRTVALAVESVLGVATLPRESVGEVPPLLGSASARAVEALGALDTELLWVLSSARVVPEDVWQRIGRQG